MRKPKVENKYNLKFSDIKNLQIVDRSRICEPLFWRNDVVGAWCISREIGSRKDIEFCTNNEVWIGIYDKPYYGKLIHCNCYSYGGVCGYNFKRFFNEKEIENELDLQTHEFIVETINMLIDEGILALRKE